MIFVLDNYDSFTYNLVQRFGEIDPAIEIVIKRNDQTSIQEIERLNPAGIIISPGPCTPNEAGLSRELIQTLGKTIPTFGVCLGHQCIGDVFGAVVQRADHLMHGKTSEIQHTGQGVFANLPIPFTATRYHSLIVPEATVPDCLEVTAWVDSEEYGREVMGLQHKQYPIHGVQFHPESYLTEAGITLLSNVLQMTSNAGNVA